MILGILGQSELDLRELVLIEERRKGQRCPCAVAEYIRAHLIGLNI